MTEQLTSPTAEQFKEEPATRKNITDFLSKHCLYMSVFFRKRAICQINGALCMFFYWFNFVLSLMQMKKK